MASAVHRYVANEILDSYENNLTESAGIAIVAGLVNQIKRCYPFPAGAHTFLFREYNDDRFNIKARVRLNRIERAIKGLWKYGSRSEMLDFFEHMLDFMYCNLTIEMLDQLYAAGNSVDAQA